MMRFSLFVLILLLNLGCNKEPQVSRNKDSKVMNLTSIRWSEEDLQELNRRMVQSILSAKNIDFAKEKNYYFGTIRNDTHDQIDTKALRNKITLALHQSSKFNFLEQQEKEDYLFKGKISSIFKKNSTTKDIFFSFNLTLLNSQTSTVIWSEDIEIRKLYKRSLFSW